MGGLCCGGGRCVHVETLAAAANIPSAAELVMHELLHKGLDEEDDSELDASNTGGKSKKKTKRRSEARFATI